MKKTKPEKKAPRQRSFSGTWSDDGQTFYLDGKSYVLAQKVQADGTVQLKTIQKGAVK